MKFDLKSVLKALIFSTSSPLSLKQIQEVFTRYHQQDNGVASRAESDRPGEEGGDEHPVEEVPSLVTATQIREAVGEINRELEEQGEVYRVFEGHDGYRFVTRPEYGVWVRLLRAEPKEAKLSQAAMETLAIVAYRQPATRADIEGIRGVSADGAINRLIERELVEIVGRADLPGRPIQYGTGERFLDFVGIRSLDELPASDVLSSRQIDEWLKENAAAKAPTDRDLGLPDEREAAVDAENPSPEADKGSGGTNGESPADPDKSPTPELQ